ncbi:MAG: TrbC/VirB2 family protein [Peptococcaceae bacterium]|nr:TrbC/VirB2 family protein [Peptococcaceae bacterium]
MKPKAIITGLLVIVLVLAMAGTVFAETTVGDNLQKSIQSSGSGGGGQIIKEEVDKIITNVVNLVRSIASILGVVFVIWAGYAYFGGSGDTQRMLMAKRMFAGFVICLICVFMAEKIVGAIFGLLGINPVS